MNNRFYMEIALNEAKSAYEKNEIPVGAVIVKDKKIISMAHNTKESSNNALHHAEILAIDLACKKLNDWRLTDCSMFVTLEPCIMCAGAIISSRIKNLYFGAYDIKNGFFDYQHNIFTKNNLSHKVDVYGGILEDNCSDLINLFFNRTRK